MLLYSFFLRGSRSPFPGSCFIAVHEENTKCVFNVDLKLLTEWEELGTS